MPKMKKEAETPPMCASCDEKPASGTLWINFKPFDEERAVSYSPGTKLPMEKGWSLHVPMCSGCLRQAVKLSVKLDVRNEAAYGHLDK